MKGRVARVKLTSEQLARLQAGRTLLIRLPKDVSILRLSTVDGDIFEQFSRRTEKFWKEIGEAWNRYFLAK